MDITGGDMHNIQRGNLNKSQGVKKSPGQNPSLQQKSQPQSENLANIAVPNPFQKPGDIKRKHLLSKKKFNPLTGEVEEVDDDFLVFDLMENMTGEVAVKKHKNGLPQLKGKSTHENREFRTKDLPDVLEAKNDIDFKGLKKTFASSVQSLKGEIGITDYRKVISKSYDSALEWNEIPVEGQDEA